GSYLFKTHTHNTPTWLITAPEPPPRESSVGGRFPLPSALLVRGLAAQNPRLGDITTVVRGDQYDAATPLGQKQDEGHHPPPKSGLPR
ncbi:hypothetical protein, partial [Streptomyces sp. NPDC060065]|uniref:hypothetical protein n=1 Tax=Streptomyces sp. NPDC060065 TaxID=3347050 RepID=UPI0036A2E9A8